MNARSCLAVALGLILIPAVQAQSVVTTAVIDAAYFTVPAGQSEATFIDEYLSSSVTQDSGLSAISPMAAAETEAWNLRNCPLSNCASMRATSHDVSGVRLAAAINDGADPRSEFRSAKSDEDSGAVLDIGLMLIFALGLLAYPLIRRQRALLHSLVLASYL